MAEFQDDLRFEHLRKLVDQVGQVPGKYSTGPNRQQRRIKQAGNSAAQRLMKTNAAVAVARELAGFEWAIACEVQTSGWQGLPTTPAARQAAAA